jgi:hypothetical protein
MDSGFIPSIIAFGLALIFVVTGAISLITGKNYMKVRDSPLDKIDGRFRFYTCIAFQFIFGAVLLIASCQWFQVNKSDRDQEAPRKKITEQAGSSNGG